MTSSGRGLASRSSAPDNALLSLGAPEQALSYLDQALEIPSATGEHASLSLLVGRAAQLSGSNERALELYERAHRDFDAVGDRDAAGRAVARRRFRSAFLGDSTKRRNVPRRPLSPLMPMVTDTYAPSSPRRWRRWRQWSANNSADDWAERALEIVEHLDAPETFLEALQSKAHSLFSMGRHKEALILYRGGVAMAETSGLLGQLADYLTSLGVTATDDEPRESLNAALRAVPVARRAGNRPLETINLLNVVEFSLLLGEWDTARSAIADVDAIHLGDHSSQIHYRDCARALLEGLTGDIGQAVRELERLAKETEAAAYIHMRATNLWYLALVRLISGELESAYAGAEAAVAVDPAGINGPSALQIQARAALWLRDRERAATARAAIDNFHGRRMDALRQTVEAGVAALSGELEQSVATYRGASRAWRELDAPFDLALCQLDMALLLDSRPEAAEAAAAAREGIESLGVTPLLDRLADRYPTLRAVPTSPG